MDPLTALLQELIRIPSVNGAENEAQIARRVQQAAADLGLQATLHARQPDRPNVLVQAGSGPPRFLFVAHLDTVAVGDPARWSHPPLAGEVADGRVWGRGACDNKAGIVCGLHALARLQELTPPGRGSFLLAGVADEESGASSPLGVRYLLDQGLIAGEGAIYTYPGRVVTIGHRGLLRFRLTVHGQSVHTGSVEWAQGRAGANAVTALAEILWRLEQEEWPPGLHPAFPDLRLTVTPGTVIQGGTFESVVPDRAEALVDARLMPGQGKELVLERTQAMVDQVLARRNAGREAQLWAEIQVKNDLPAAHIPPQHPLAQACVEATRRVTGETPPVAGCGPSNEGYMLIQAGIPTIAGFGPVGGNAHAPDEWVAVESLAETVAIYVEAVRLYCGI